MPTIDLRADLNAEDDEGRWWSLLRDAADPAAVVPGVVLSLAPSGSGRSYASNKSTTTARFTSSPSRPTIPPRLGCSRGQPDLVGLT